MLYTEDWVLSSEELPNTLRTLQHDFGYQIIICLEVIQLDEAQMERVRLLARQFMERTRLKDQVAFWVYECDVPIQKVKEQYLRYINCNRFTETSFFCGDEISPQAMYPWYRRSDRDACRASQLDLRLIEPRQILGDYPIPILPQDTSLILTCGRSGSGWEIAAKQRQPPLDIEQRQVQYWTTAEVLKSPEPILIRPDQICVVFGSHLSLAERQAVTGRFILPIGQGYLVHWYSRIAALGPDTRPLDHPATTEESWVRVM